MLHYSTIAHVILVFQSAFQRDGYNLHVVMRVGAITASGCHLIVFEDAQDPKMHAVRFVVTGKVETVVAVQPAMVGLAAGIGQMQRGLEAWITICHEAKLRPQQRRPRARNRLGLAKIRPMTMFCMP